MITHYIIMSSSYSMGKRIALDYCLDTKIDLLKVKDVFTDIIKECGKDVSLSTHFIQADSETWGSVIEKDHFFKDVEIIKEEKEFITLIKKDRILVGLDIAKYILCKVKCTHMKLEKLVYLCFADYLCKYDKELYKDKIYAYKWGPIVKSVYDKYKGYRDIDTEDQDIDANDVFEMPSKSRILFAEDGINKIKSIEDTLEKYGHYTAADLVRLTHKDMTPWNISGQGKELDKIIDNETIKKYHNYEMI